MLYFNLSFFLEIGLILVILGLVGLIINKNNILISIICLELTFYGLNFYLIVAGLEINDIMGEIFSLFVLTVAASESAIALAMIVLYFKIFKNIFLEIN